MERPQYEADLGGRSGEQGAPAAGLYRAAGGGDRRPLVHGRLRAHLCRYPGGVCRLPPTAGGVGDIDRSEGRPSPLPYQKKRERWRPQRFGDAIFLRDYAFSNSLLPRPHTGQTQSEGTSSQGVPGATPLSGSPTAGSYS